MTERELELKGDVTEDKEVKGRYTLTSKCKDGILKETPFSVSTYEHSLHVEFRPELDYSSTQRYSYPEITFSRKSHRIVEVIAIPFQEKIEVIIEPIVRPERANTKIINRNNNITPTFVHAQNDAHAEGIYTLRLENPSEFEKFTVISDENGLNVDFYKKGAEQVSTRFTETALKQTTHRISKVSGRCSNKGIFEKGFIIVVAESIRPQQWTWWRLIGNCTLL